MFTIETDDKRPLILLFGQDKTLIAQLAQELSSKAHLVYCSQDSALPVNNVSYLRFSDIASLTRIKEKISHAIVYLSDVKEKTLIGELIPKLEKDKTRVQLVIPAHKLRVFIDTITRLQKIKNCIVTVIGNIYSEDFIYDSPLAHVINQAVTKKKVILTGNDLVPTFPIHIKDAVEALQSLLFSSIKEHVIYYVFYEHPKTIISSIHLIRRVEPELEIELKKNISSAQVFYTQDHLDQDIASRLHVLPIRLFKGTMDFERSINSMISHAPHKTSSMKQTIQRGLKSAHRDHSPRIARFLLFLVFLIGFVHVVLFAALGYYTHATMESGKKYQLQQMYTNARISNTILPTLYPSLYITNKLTHIFQKNYYITEQYDAVKTMLGAFIDTEESVQTLEKRRKEFDEKELKRLLANIQTMYTTLQKLELYNSPLTTYLPITNVKKNASFLSFSNLLPDVLGYKKEMKYLLLFQNNGEIRPTGGFIGSVGELSLTKGQVSNFTIQDVYDLDGQLKAHIEPHYILRRYLQQHLYLRDSNFDIDFVTSASKAAQLYYLETGKRVDAVIGINYTVLEQIIQTVGPLQLYEYNKTLDEKTLFSYLQETIEKNFFPGSSQKRDILRSVYDALFVQIVENKQNLAKVALLMPDLIEKKHILFAFQDPYIQESFQTQGFSGSYRDTRTKNPTTVYDILSINEANIGANKVNTLVRRQMQYSVRFNKANVETILTLKLINESPDDTYKTYIRYITPQTSVLGDIVIDNVKQTQVPAITDFREYEKQGFVAPAGLEVDTSVVEDKVLYGFVTEVPKNSSKTVEIQVQKGKVPASEVFYYSLLLFKQPGIPSFPLKVTLQPPNGYTIEEREKTVLVEDDVQIDTTLKKK